MKKSIIIGIIIALILITVAIIVGVIIGNGNIKGNQERNVDYEKVIDVNGNKYKFTCLGENNNGNVKIKLCLNDKEIKTVFVDSYYEDEKYVADAFKLNNNGIIITIKYNTPSGDMVDFYIFDLDGKYIDHLSWSGAGSIYNKVTKEYYTYEIVEEGLILYKVNYNPNSSGIGLVSKIRYTIDNESLKQEELEKYNAQDIILAGKY